MGLAARMIPVFLLACLTGVFVASLVIPPIWVVLLFVLTGISVSLLVIPTRSTRLLILALCVLGIALGMFRFMIWEEKPTDPVLDEHVGSRISVIGVVRDDPDVREGKTHLIISLEAIKKPDTITPVSGTLIAFVDRYPTYQYGDRVLFEGKLTIPKAFTGDDGREFDYPAYLRVKNIHYQMSFAETSRLGSGEGNPLLAMLYDLKHGFTSAIGRALPEPHSALLSGLLLGGKQSLGETWLERFRIAGIIHVVVLSGYNMTIVAEWIMVVFGFLGFFTSLALGAIGIILFALMTGVGATVVRAAIMALIVLLARATGRTATMGRALLFAGALMVFVHPSILMFDPSFQLSFLASLGLVFVSPVIGRRIAIWKKYPLAREALLSTIATQIAVLPLLLYQTGMLSLVSLPVNLLVVPMIPFTMFFGFVGGVLSFFLPSLGTIGALPAYGLLSWILGAAEYSSNIPYASVTLAITPIVVVILYALLVGWLVREHRRYGAVTSPRPESELR